MLLRTGRICEDTRTQSKKNIKDFEANYRINDTPGPSAGNASRQHLVPQRLDGFIGSFAIDPLADKFVTRHADLGSRGRGFQSQHRETLPQRQEASPLLPFCAFPVTGLPSRRRKP
jgi:hypothetical protein